LSGIEISKSPRELNSQLLPHVTLVEKIKCSIELNNSTMRSVIDGPSRDPSVVNNSSIQYTSRKKSSELDLQSIEKSKDNKYLKNNKKVYYPE
jgi:hypothetical protein